MGNSLLTKDLFEKNRIFTKGENNKLKEIIPEKEELFLKNPKAKEMVEKILLERNLSKDREKDFKLNILRGLIYIEGTKKWEKGYQEDKQIKISSPLEICRETREFWDDQEIRDDGEIKPFLGKEIRDILLEELEIDKEQFFSHPSPKYLFCKIYRTKFPHLCVVERESQVVRKTKEITEKRITQVWSLEIFKDEEIKVLTSSTEISSKPKQQE